MRSRLYRVPVGRGMSHRARLSNRPADGALMMGQTLGAPVTAVLLLVVPSTAFGQSIFAGGGVTIPTGHFADSEAAGAEPGWLATAGVLINVGESGVSIGGEGFYGQTPHENEGERTKSYGAMALLGYRVRHRGAAGPYFWGGVGLMAQGTRLVINGRPEDRTDSHFGYQAGTGLDVPFAGNLGAYLEGRFMGSKEVNFFGVIVGLDIGLGG